MGQSRGLISYRMEIVSLLEALRVPTQTCRAKLTRNSYIVYIALISMYLVLIWFFFPETRYVILSFSTVARQFLMYRTTRRMTIEEVSVLFDTGRKGDAQAVALHFDKGKGEIELNESIGDAEKQAHAKVVSHVE